MEDMLHEMQSAAITLPDRAVSNSRGDGKSEDCSASDEPVGEPDEAESKDEKD